MINKRDKQCHQCSESVENTISDIDFIVELINEHAAYHEKRNDVNDETVASP